MPIIYPNYLLMVISLEVMPILRDVDPCKKNLFTIVTAYLDFSKSDGVLRSIQLGQ